MEAARENKDQACVCCRARGEECLAKINKSKRKYHSTGKGEKHVLVDGPRVLQKREKKTQQS